MRGPGELDRRRVTGAVNGRSAAAVLVLLMGAALVGCGSGGSSPDPTAPTSSSSPAASANQFLQDVEGTCTGFANLQQTVAEFLAIRSRGNRILNLQKIRTVLAEMHKQFGLAAEQAPPALMGEYKQAVLRPSAALAAAASRLEHGYRARVSKGQFARIAAVMARSEASIARYGEKYRLADCAQHSFSDLTA